MSSFFSRLASWLNFGSTSAITPPAPAPAPSTHPTPTVPMPPGKPISQITVGRFQRLDGMPLNDLQRITTGIQTDQGASVEFEQRSFVTTGDGQVRSDLEGLQRCELCWLMLSQAVVAGAFDPETAIRKSLFAPELIRRTTAGGIPVCPAHAAVLPTPDGPVIITSVQAEELQRQAIINGPIDAVLGLFRRKPKP